MKLIKIIIINFLVLFSFIIVVELFFGSWIFKKNHLNLINVSSNTTNYINVKGVYDSTTSIIKYSRDKYGFRGVSTYNNPSKIDILTIGGSTTAQLLIDDKKTWQCILEEELKEHGLNYNVADAGIGGQSTYGHIKNFQFWFPLVPSLRPRYIIFYIGINDFYRMGNDKFDDIRNDNSIRFKIANNSALNNLRRKIIGILRANKAGLAINSGTDYSKIKYTLQKRLIEKADYQTFFGNRLHEYSERLKILVDYSKKYGAETIFVTQPSPLFKVNNDGSVMGKDTIFQTGDFHYNGLDYYYLLNEMNKEIFNVAKLYNLMVIDLTNLNIWEENDFYDFCHNTPSGAKKVGEEIAKKIIKKVKENQDGIN